MDFCRGGGNPPKSLGCSRLVQLTRTWAQGAGEYYAVRGFDSIMFPNPQLVINPLPPLPSPIRSAINMRDNNPFIMQNGQAISHNTKRTQTHLRVAFTFGGLWPRSHETRRKPQTRSHPPPPPSILLSHIHGNKFAPAHKLGLVRVFGVT